jgi:hypothetical protein
MLRFAFAIVLGLHAWSSELLAADCPNPIALKDGVDVVRLFATRTENGVCVLGLTQSDIDVFTKRLDGLEQLLRCVLRNQETVSVARNATVQENCP